MSNLPNEEPDQRSEPALPPPPADDPMAEWVQRALAGMKRMADDPEHQAAIGKRVS